MKKLIFIIALLLSSLPNSDLSAVAACDSSQSNLVAASRKKTIKREIPCNDDISKIMNHTPISVNLIHGKPNIIIKGPEENIDNVRVMISGTTVSVISADRTGKIDMSGVEVTIYAKDISTLVNFGSGSINADRLDSTGTKIQSLGAGDIDIETMDCTGTQINNSGSGNITITSLDCTSLRSILQGSGDILIKSADTTGVELTAQGSGSIKIKSIDCTTLKAYNQGSGNIEVAGDATSVKLYNQGSGTIVAKGLDCTRITKVNSGSGNIRD